MKLMILYAFAFVPRTQLISEQHHPVAVSQYYEDQKEESLKKAADFRANRIVSPFPASIGSH